MKRETTRVNEMIETPKPAARSVSRTGAQPQIRVAIVEDNDWLRARLAREIGEAAGFACLGAFRSAEAALQGIPTLLPDVVLMDINLPGMDGVKCVRRLKELCPEVQFLMLTVYEETEKIFSSLLAGARGYLLKRATTKELIEAIHQVEEGGTPMADHIAREMVAYFNQKGEERASTVEALSPREKQVLEWLAQGASYKEAADHLSLSIDTIKMNTQHIYRKLHVHSRGEAVAKYLSS
jgi:DNA-binding NarL/FixJ family response regulator